MNSGDAILSPATTRALRVLVVEDNSIDRRQVERLLLKSSRPIFEITQADCLEKALAILDNEGVDVVLLDLNLPDSRGLDSVVTVHQSHPTMPIVVATGQGGEELGLAAIAEGAQDYLVKYQFDSQMLSRTLSYAHERKRAEQVLRRQRDKAQKYLDVAGVMFVSLDAEGQVTLVNKKGCEVLGYDEAEIVGKNWFDDFLPECIRPEVRGVHEGLMAGETDPFEYYENPVLTSTGDERLIAWHNTVLADEDGGTIGTLSSGEDITERKQAEEALRGSEEKYKTVVENIPQRIFTKDRDLLYMSCNENFAKDMGITADELPGKTDYDFFPKELADKYRADDRRLMDAGKIEDIEEKYIEDGRDVWVHTVKTPLKDDQGNTIGILGIFRDITESKQTQEEVKCLKRQIEFILGATNTGIDIVDSQFNIRYIDPERQKVYGDPTGRKCYEYFQDHDEVCQDCSVVRALETRQIRITEEVLPKEDNRRVQVTTMPFQNEEGEWVVAEVNTDITERKKAEEDVRRANEKLEDANRKLKDMQSQMVQSEKLASIGELAAGVAHEMNTPVGFVSSNFQTLRGYMDKFLELFAMYEKLAGEVESGVREHRLSIVEETNKKRAELKIDFVLDDIQQLFDESKEGLDRITSIIQNLRDFSRIDQAEEFDEYDLNAGIKATLVVARNEIKYDADVVTELSEDLPMVFCHSGQINQVFLNILINAAQAIKSQDRGDKGTVTVRTYTSQTDVVCEISDNGPGIPADKLPKIFDPFFTTKPAGKGTGLGLSVSYDIVVNKHRGRLIADSIVGEGTKFTIKLPIRTKEPESEEHVCAEREL